MWAVDDRTNKISMAEGDWGIELPVSFVGITLAESDGIKFTIKLGRNSKPILEKTFTQFENNGFNFVLTEEESALLPVGSLVYVLDWYRAGSFLCNTILRGAFIVEDKA